MPKRTLTLLAVTLLAASLLAACRTGPAKPKELTQVRFTAVIHSVFYAPQYVAQAKGFFKEEGIDLVASTAQGSDRGTAALLAGTADIALVGPETTIFMVVSEGPLLRSQKRPAQAKENGQAVADRSLLWLHPSGQLL